MIGLESHGAKRVVKLDDGSSVAARAVLLATGVSYRRLPAEGADDFLGKGVYYGSATTQAADCEGQQVVIVGGANSAGQAAVFFARYAAQVTMVVRGPGLERSMSHYLIEQIAGIPNIEVRTCSELIAVQGDGHLDRAVVRNTQTGVDDEIFCAHVFAFIGAQPFTDWLPDTVARDPGGFVLTGTELSPGGKVPENWPLDRAPYLLESSLPGVFVAGDVRAQSVKRVASAVGEGALAVTLVHRYLETP